MSYTGLYVFAINIPDYYENTRGYSDVRLYPWLFVWFTLLYWKNINNYSI